MSLINNSFKFKSFLKPHIESFITYRKAGNNWNDTYESNMRNFDNYCYQNKDNDISLQEIVDTWSSKRETEINKSRNNRVFVIKHFVRYLIDRDITNVIEPTLFKKENRVHIPHFFTNEELKNFFCACDTFCRNPKTINQHIRKINVPVFFRLLYSTGMRPVEARMLKVEDVDFEQGVLNIQESKGYNQHFVVLDDSTSALLKKYNIAIKKYCPNRKYFFSPNNNSHYSGKWVKDNFKKRWIKYNGATPAVAYDLRHHYAITNINEWIGEGFEFYDKLLYLSKSMGHKSLESTKYYYTLVPSLAKIIEENTGENFNSIVPEVFLYEEI